MRIVPALALLAAAMCAPSSSHGDALVHAPRERPRSDLEPRITRRGGVAMSPAALQQLARKNARARQTKRGKRGRR